MTMKDTAQSVSRMTAVVAPGRHKELNDISVVPIESIGSLDFWNVSQSHIRFEKVGDNTNQMSKIVSRLTAVTVSEQPSVSDAIEVVDTSSFSFEKIFDTVSRNKNAVLAPSSFAIGIISLLGAYTIISSFVFGALVLMLGVASLTTSVFTSVFFIADKMEKKAGKKSVTAPHPKAGKFPSDEKFAVMTYYTAFKLIELLKKRENDAILVSLVERKLEVEKDHEAFKSWVHIVLGILTLDPNFPSDAVPLMLDDARAVLQDVKEVIEKRAAREAERVRVEAENKNREENELIALSSTADNVMLDYAKEDSSRARGYAADYLQGVV